MPRGVDPDGGGRPLAPFAALASLPAHPSHPPFPPTRCRQVDATLFGGFLLAAAAHTREQHSLQPCRLSLLSAAAIGAVGAAVLAALAAGDTPPLGPP